MMRSRENYRRGESRRGVAAVELAVLLPLLAFLLVIGIDFARVFYHHLTITNAARNAAIWASQSTANSTNTAGIQAMALRDCSDLSPTPTVTSTTGTGPNGNPYVTVSVTYPFQTITHFPGIASPTLIGQSCQMRVQPAQPKPGTY